MVRDREALVRGRARPVGVGGHRAAIIVAAVAAVLLLAFLAVFFIWPVAEILWRGIAPDGVPQLGPLLEVLGRPRTLRIIGLTLGQAALATAVCLLLGTPLAFVLHRLRFRGRAALRALALVPFVLPTVVVGVAFKVLFAGTPLDGSWWSIVLALVFFNVAVVALAVGSAWEGLDPALEEAAADLGAGPLRTFAAITLPRLGPAIAAAAVIVFLYCTAAFGIVLVLGGDRFGTIETEIWSLATQRLDLPGASALSLVQVLLVVVLLVGLGLIRVRPELRAPGAGRPPRRGDAGMIAVASAIGALLAAPVVALVLRSLRGADGWTLANWAALATGSTAGIAPLEALWHSLAFALGGMAIALAVGIAASALLARPPRAAWARRVADVFDGALLLPLGVSAVTVGFGYLVALDQPPFDLRASPLLVVIAQAVVAAPLVVRGVLPALRGVDPLLRDAAADLGATPLQVLRRIDLPLASRQIAAAAGLAFAVCLGEFGATSFLARPETATLPVLVERLAGRPGPGGIGPADAAAVLLALVAAAALALGELRRPTRLSRRASESASPSPRGGTSRRGASRAR